jgi:hypothetical protein
MPDYESLSDEDKRAVGEYEDSKMKKIAYNDGPINSKNKPYEMWHKNTVRYMLT